MNFSLEYTKEQEQFAQEVRAWLDEHAPKNVGIIRDTVKMDEVQLQKLRDLGRKLGAKGWLYPGYPKEYGGGGMDMDHIFVLREELAKRDLGLPPLYDTGILAVPGVMACGTEAQKKRFLPPIFKGEVLTWQLFTEPEAGTDEANQHTNALRSEREKDYFIVNGQKIFVGSFPSRPEQLYLLTRSDLKASRHQNLSSFLIPADLPGITIQPLDLFPLSTFQSVCGVTAANIAGVKHSVFFDDVKIHESRLIGKEGEGWRVTNATLEVEHGGGAGIMMNRVAEKFLTQCQNNPYMQKRLKENPHLLNSLVDIYIGAQIERLFSMRNFNGKGGRYGGPQLSVFSKGFGTRCIADLAKVLGPSTFTDDEVWGMDEDIFEVGQRCGVCQAPGGTPEALKIGIARALGIGR